MEKFQKVLTLSEDPNTPGLPRFADNVSINITPNGVAVSFQEKFAKKNGQILNGDGVTLGNINRPYIEGEEKEAADKKAAALIAKIAPIIQDFVNS